MFQILRESRSVMNMTPKGYKWVKNTITTGYRMIKEIDPSGNIHVTHEPIEESNWVLVPIKNRSL